MYVRCVIKRTVQFSKIINFFINNYLVPFKVNPLRYNTLIPAFFPTIETLLKRVVGYRQ